jgi:hypothetical protein
MAAGFRLEAKTSLGKSTFGGRRLQFESLERREVMAAGITTSLTGSTLTVTCTDQNDQVRFLQLNNRIAIANVSGSWAASGLSAIIVDLKGGNDSVSLVSTANGGNQALAKNFSIRTGSGTETVRLANGTEATISGANRTFGVAANGAATLDGRAWSPAVAPPPAPPAPPAPPPPPPPPSGNWFDSNVVDTGLRALGSTLYVDRSINRTDMINLLRNAEDGGVIDATELTDLRRIVATTTLFSGAEHVWKLASYIVSPNAANAKYQGQALGDLVVDSAAAKMENLINKWYLGLDRPTTSGTYRQFTGRLFVGGAHYMDIKQGGLGDCYFLASLSEVALKNPSAITGMFFANGDGTYAVRFYNGSTPQYVTVDSFLPTNALGAAIYAGVGTMASNGGAELWVSLAEKAYVQANEFGWTRAGLSGSGQNAYNAISGGYIYAALGHITGRATTPFTSTAGPASFTAFVAAFNQGKMIGFASKSAPASTSVVGNHAYAVVGYNTANQTIMLYNPWGPGYAQLTLTWAQVQANFGYFDRTA